MEEITKEYNISRIQILGGEVSLLDKEYIDKLYNIIKKYTCAVTTNLSNNWLINYCLQNNIEIGVSLNEERPYYNETLNKLKKLKNIKLITLSSVVLPSLINKEPREVLKFYESLGFTIYFLQYHPSLTNNIIYDLTLNDYNIFMENIIKEYNSNIYNIKIGNEIAFHDTSHSASFEDCLFINPNGKLSEGLANEQGFEYFKEFNDIKEYSIFKSEYKLYRLEKCKQCDFFNICLGKHILSSNHDKCSKLFNLFYKQGK